MEIEMMVQYDPSIKCSGLTMISKPNQNEVWAGEQFNAAPFFLFELRRIHLVLQPE